MFWGCFHTTTYCTRHASLQIHLYCSDGGSLSDHSHFNQGSIQDHPAAVKTAKASRKKVDDDTELLTVPIDPGVLLNLCYVSASRQNFTTNVMRKLFTRAERETSIMNGVLGKTKLDVDKVEYIK